MCTLVSRVDSVFLSSLGKIPCTLVSRVVIVLLSSLGKVLDVLLLSLGWILYSCPLSERYYMNSCCLSVGIALFSSLGWMVYSCRFSGRYCVLLLPTHSLPLPGSCPLSGKCYILVFFRTVVISWDYTLCLAMPTFSPIGSRSSNGMRMCVCVCVCVCVCIH